MDVGLQITPVSSSQIPPFEVWGAVTSKKYAGEMIYYCNGQSFPESIVSEVYSLPISKMEELLKSGRLDEQE